MAAKKDINSFLKETGYTEEQMEAFFEDLALSNRIIKNFKAKGITWNLLDIRLIKLIPTQKEKDLIIHEKLRKEAEEEKLRREKEILIIDPVIEGQLSDDLLVDDLLGWIPQDTRITDHIELVKRVGPEKDENNEA